MYRIDTADRPRQQLAGQHGVVRPEVESPAAGGFPARRVAADERRAGDGGAGDVIKQGSCISSNDRECPTRILRSRIGQFKDTVLTKKKIRNLLFE